MHSIIVNDQRMHFSSAHFVLGADYCENLHGHNYFVEITVSGKIDSLGMVMDFKTIKKQAIRICEILDHKTMLPGQSKTIEIQEDDYSIEVNVSGKRYVFPKEDCVVIPSEATTAELLAEYIAKELALPDEFRVKVCVSESLGSKGCFQS